MHREYVEILHATYDEIALSLDFLYFFDILGWLAQAGAKWLKSRYLKHFIEDICCVNLYEVQPIIASATLVN